VTSMLHDQWEAVAPGWEAHAAYVDARGAALTERLLALTAPAPGDRVLELACGPGGPGFAAAGLVGPAGEVVVSDVSPAMTDIARRRAATHAHGPVRTRVLDLEAIDEHDAAFDVVLCREGLMLVADPSRAAREIHRVLRPGGRLALSVWGPRAGNPWLAVVFEAVSAQIGAPIPPPGTPHPFALDDAERLAGVLTGGGLADVEVAELPVPYVAASVDEWWERTAALAGPLAARLASLPGAAAQALRDRAARAAEPYLTADGLRFPGVALVASARRD
jgi:SAM-dependent methyltransferase